MKINDIMRERRKELGLTLKQVAERTGVSEGTISRWESGKISEMRRGKVAAYAKAIDIDPAIIMGWKEISEYSAAKARKYVQKMPYLRAFLDFWTLQK